MMNNNEKSVILQIEGLHCASCVGRVEKALLSAEGVKSASVNLATGKAKVTYNPETSNPEKIADAVVSAGYGAIPEKTASFSRTFNVGGMSCASCVRAVEKALLKTPGVTDARVNLATGKALLESNGELSDEVIKNAVEGAGFEFLGADSPIEEEKKKTLRGATASA